MSERCYFDERKFDEALIESYSESLAERPGEIGTVWLTSYPIEFDTRVSMVSSPIFMLLLCVENVR